LANWPEGKGVPKRITAGILSGGTFSRKTYRSRRCEKERLVGGADLASDSRIPGRRDRCSLRMASCAAGATLGAGDGSRSRSMTDIDWDIRWPGTGRARLVVFHHDDLAFVEVLLRGIVVTFFLIRRVNGNRSVLYRRFSCQFCRRGSFVGAEATPGSPIRGGRLAFDGFVVNFSPVVVWR